MKLSLEMVHLLFGVGICCVCLVFGVYVFDNWGVYIWYFLVYLVFGIFKFVSTLVGNPICLPPLIIKLADKRPKQRQSR